MHHDFKTSNYFSGMPYILGFILLPIGFILLFSPKIIVGVGLLVTGAAIVTTHFRLAINHNQKIYTEYISLFGMKVSKEVSRFEVIEYIFIKKSRVSQNLNSRASSTTIRKDQFDGYLKFSEDDKVHLFSFEDKSVLLKRLRPIARIINVRMIDYSVEHPVEIK